MRTQTVVAFSSFLLFPLLVLFTTGLVGSTAAARTPQVSTNHSFVSREPKFIVFAQSNASSVVPVMSTIMYASPSSILTDSSIASAVSAGRFHTCALTAVGGVVCWGANYYGQLGDGTTADRVEPVSVNGLSEGIQAVSASWSHTCALTATGGVKCWGRNYFGELGDGTKIDRLTPVDVDGLISGVQAISAGENHTCALTTAGGVKCWGENYYGQLGDGTKGDHLTPVDVSGLTSGVQAISAGSIHTCALTIGGGVKCWGGNWNGSLGDGTTTSHPAPVDASGLSSGVQAVSVGNEHTCALSNAGGMKCWGYNYSGQLGDGTTINRLAAVDVSGLINGVQAIATGGDHTCALTTVGGVKCWGHNGNGQLGDGTTTDRLSLVDVSGLASGVQAITATSSNHTCALTSTGGVKCWGWNISGQLGDGTTTDRWAPVDVLTLLPPPAVTPTPTSTSTPTATPTSTPTPTPTPTLQALSDLAEVGGQMEHPTVAPATSLTIWYEVHNTGTATWSADKGYGWRGTGQWQGTSGSITSIVGPDQKWSLVTHIVTPSEPGTYIYGFVLQHNGREFGPNFSVQITVLPHLYLPHIIH